MMKKGKELESILKFQKYYVNKIEFNRNSEFSPVKSMKLDFSIDRKITHEDGNKTALVTLRVKIFEDAMKNNYPFSMSVELVGEFAFENADNINLKLLEQNAIAILFPYVRAIISTYTAAANVQPLILPTINVVALMNEQDADSK